MNPPVDYRLEHHQPDHRAVCLGIAPSLVVGVVLADRYAVQLQDAGAIGNVVIVATETGKIIYRQPIDDLRQERAMARRGA